MDLDETGDWREYSFQKTATSSSTVISFESINAFCFTGVDDVYVEASSQAVPEPATMLLLGLGVVGLAGLRRKMK